MVMTDKEIELVTEAINKVQLSSNKFNKDELDNIATMISQGVGGLKSVEIMSYFSTMKPEKMPELFALDAGNKSKK